MHRCFNQFKLCGEERKLMLSTGGRVKLIAYSPGTAEHSGIAA